ncbi:Retrovirus-related Pol polyprotein from transposon opus, partial [Mucuna pruriens]
MTTRTKMDMHARTFSMEFAMKHPTKDHSLFGIDIIDELVEEYIVEIPNFVQLPDITDCFDSMMDVLDSVNMPNMQDLSDSVDNIADLANLVHVFEFSDLIDLGCRCDGDLKCSNSNNLYREQEEKLLNVLRKHKRKLGGRYLTFRELTPHLRSPTDKVVVEMTKSEHPGCSQERSDKTNCSRDHLSHLGQPMGQSGIVLERLARKFHYCFLDGFFRYMQIHIALENQHKTTFTCPFGTFAYTQMLFGLCNAPSMFQRCMINIFLDFLEDCMEVFMDDFTVYAESFEAYLKNLFHVLIRCIEMNLVLNFEKCHFMIIEGILLGYLVSNRGIEVDKFKVDIITSLSYPTSVQEVCSFLGHAVLHGGFLGVEEATYIHIDSPSTKLGVSSCPRLKSWQVAACHSICFSNNGSGLDKLHYYREGAIEARCEAEMDASPLGIRLGDQR